MWYYMYVSDHGEGGKKYWPAETGVKQEQGRHGAGDKHDWQVWSASLASALIKFNKNNEARVNKIGSLPEPNWRRPDHSLHMSQVHEETI